jgi:hypothetical protein
MMIYGFKVLNLGSIISIMYGKKLLKLDGCKST